VRAKFKESLLLRLFLSLSLPESTFFAVRNRGEVFARGLFAFLDENLVESIGKEDV